MFLLRLCGRVRHGQNRGAGTFLKWSKGTSLRLFSVLTDRQNKVLPGWHVPLGCGLSNTTTQRGTANRLSEKVIPCTDSVQGGAGGRLQSWSVQSNCNKLREHCGKIAMV